VLTIGIGVARLFVVTHVSVYSSIAMVDKHREPTIKWFLDLFSQWIIVPVFRAK
jgi:hypothetical protein